MQQSLDRMFSSALVAKLAALDESPWGSLRGEAITTRKLASMLKPYGITHGTIRIGEQTAKGYTLEDLHDAFLRYLPASVTTVTTDTRDDLGAWTSDEYGEER